MAKAKHKINNSLGDKIFDVINYIVLTLILIIVAYPIYFVIISSISDPAAVASGQVKWFPIKLNFEGYEMVFKDKALVQGFINSVIYTVVGTLTNLIVTIPAAYALSRDDLKGRKYIMIFFMITMFVGGGLMPTYLVVQSLGLVDSMWSLILPGAISVYNMIVARTFFQANLSGEILDAAKIDGCSNTQFFIRIALPLSKAIIAILVLYYGVGHWNSYFSSLIYITSPEKFPLQLVLRSILVQSTMQQEMVKDLAELQKQQQLAELMKYSLIIISSVPMLLLYPFVQKHFVKGVMIGSIKG